MNGLFARRFGEWLMDRRLDDNIHFGFRREPDGTETLWAEAIQVDGMTKKLEVPER